MKWKWEQKNNNWGLWSFHSITNQLLFSLSPWIALFLASSVFITYHDPSLHFPKNLPPYAFTCSINSWKMIHVTQWLRVFTHRINGKMYRHYLFLPSSACTLLHAKYHWLGTPSSTPVPPSEIANSPRAYSFHHHDLIIHQV